MKRVHLETDLLVDGKAMYACTARLEPRAMRLALLANKALVRDRVTEVAPPGERLGHHPVSRDHPLGKDAGENNG